MRKIFFFVSASLMLGCSGDDNSNSNQNSNNSKINPPTWIQGNWILENAGADYGFRFTPDDVCIKSIGIYACNKEAINGYEGTQIKTDVHEEITDNKYDVEITIGSNITSYKFEKVSSTEIKWMNGSNNAVLTKE